MEAIQFNNLNDSDLQAVKEIYDYYIKHTTATFHTEPISISELQEIIYINHPRYKSCIIYYDNVMVGYCYLAPYKKRQAYDRSAEVTLYLKPEFTQKGIGTTALEHLENAAKKAKFHCLLSVISGDNHESIKLFEKAGYTKCGTMRHVGEKFGLILDVTIYQKEM
jgi:L-amino acid N-acyltransferase YncA